MQSNQRGLIVQVVHSFWKSIPGGHGRYWEVSSIKSYRGWCSPKSKGWLQLWYWSCGSNWHYTVQACSPVSLPSHRGGTSTNPVLQITAGHSLAPCHQKPLSIGYTASDKQTHGTIAEDGPLLQTQDIMTSEKPASGCPLIRVHRSTARPRPTLGSSWVAVLTLVYTLAKWSCCAFRRPQPHILQVCLNILDSPCHILGWRHGPPDLPGLVRLGYLELLDLSSKVYIRP